MYDYIFVDVIHENVDLVFVEKWCPLTLQIPMESVTIGLDQVLQEKSQCQCSSPFYVAICF